MARTHGLAALSGVALLFLACSAEEPPAEPAPLEELEPGLTQEPTAETGCPDRNPLRNPYFGDLHVHTSLSFDAYAADVRTSPDDAYRFARGEAIELPPLDESGRGLRRAQLERPLDFAGVTDHAEWLGEVSLCTSPDSPSYATNGCAIYRGEKASSTGLEGLAGRMTGITASDPQVATAGGRPTDVCGDDGSTCRTALQSVWQGIQATNERQNDPCRFTAFHAYEYTATPEMSKVHRNVIFRSAAVPNLPISWVDEPLAHRMWRRLKQECLDAGNGCDVLSIPHNSNLSNGRMFTVDYREEPLGAQRGRAALRARLEPLVEIAQTKGDSECRNGLFEVAGGNDELCNFEKFRGLGDVPDCEEGTGSGALAGEGCISRLDFVRYALIEGLRERDRIGVNPYKLGIIASTDTHNSTPGDAEERSFQGLFGSRDHSPERRLGQDTTFAGAIRNLAMNPGGLVGVWAQENTREALFDAMKRRETFGTSGPRIAPRLFGGWDYPLDLCESADLVARADRSGTPMGGDLPRSPRAEATPTFVAMAERDPGTDALPGGKLQRIQIIKGWVGDDGHFHQAIYDVAGSRGPISVDPTQCAQIESGHDSLCAVWTDRDFDPGRRAVYYARVLENPSCRWNALQCVELEAEDRPRSCSDRRVPKLIQERAWTSPIWYDSGS